MSLSALVYRSRASLHLNVESLGALRNDHTGEYYFPTPELEAQFPSETFIAHEFWIGNISSVAELRTELREVTLGTGSILLEKVLRSGSHSGDIIALDTLPVLEAEVRELLDREGLSLSTHLTSVLNGILRLVQVAKKENNPIVFV